MDSATTMPKNRIHRLRKGKKAVADYLEAVPRKIDCSFRINYLSTEGTEHSVEWDGKMARASEQHSPE
jgi:ketosteroid isomerase-like protein